MNWLQKRRERRERNRDVSLLWGKWHDAEEQLLAVEADRDYWRELAIDAQLEAEQLKGIVQELKS